VLDPFGVVEGARALFNRLATGAQPAKERLIEGASVTEILEDSRSSGSRRSSPGAWSRTIFSAVRKPRVGTVASDSASADVSGAGGRAQSQLLNSGTRYASAPT
jgi:hypothetical protein